MAAAASSTNTTQGPAAAQTDAFEVFRQGVTSVFKTWMVLHLAVENNWGGGDSERKAALLLEETLALFVPSAKRKRAPEQDDVEEKLELFLDDQFETIADDGSIEEVSEIIMKMYRQCVGGDFSLVQQVLARQDQVLRMQHRFAETSNQYSRSHAERHDEGDAASDDDAEDVGYAPQGSSAGAAMEAPTPSEQGMAAVAGSDGMEVEEQIGGGSVVDEDGWTTVTSRRKSSRRSAGNREVHNVGSF